MKLLFLLLLSGCAATQAPAVVIEVPIGAGAQCFELPGTIRVSYYENKDRSHFVGKLLGDLIDFGLLDSIWSETER